ncbi:DNA primase regulatory subunit PriL [Halarchaeum salinum]|uniref:DNA primase regulatory subunit PriL n=1 Tax=Halarchaeum salinum TaxID=489912 RepID=UPI001B8853AF
MERRHARYPFLGDARHAVQEAGVDLVEVVREEDAVVERASERVASAIADRDVGESVASDRVELLSYPVARVIVSLVDENVCTRYYAEAEASRAAERFREDFGREDGRAAITRRAVLREFDLGDAVTPQRDGGFAVGVAAYLRHASSLRGDEWRLVNRALAVGDVPVSEPELDDLLREAVEERVKDGLPLQVPDAIGDALDEPVASIRETLADLDLTREIDTVVPDLFPPCMQHLLDAVQRGDHLPHHSRFALTAFLGNIGLSTDEIVELYEVNPGFGEEMTRYQTDHIKGESSPTEYTAPSCATMQAYGDCVNPDALCEHISHPLSYYEAKIDDADEEELEDWREGRDGDEESADADA